MQTLDDAWYSLQYIDRRIIIFRHYRHPTIQDSRTDMNCGNRWVLSDQVLSLEWIEVDVWRNDCEKDPPRTNPTHSIHGNFHTKLAVHIVFMKMIEETILIFSVSFLRLDSQYFFYWILIHRTRPFHRQELCTVRMSDNWRPSTCVRSGNARFNEKRGIWSR